MRYFHIYQEENSTEAYSVIIKSRKVNRVNINYVRVEGFMPHPDDDAKTIAFASYPKNKKEKYDKIFKNIPVSHVKHGDRIISWYEKSKDILDLSYAGMAIIVPNINVAMCLIARNPSILDYGWTVITDKKIKNMRFDLDTFEVH